ncbi:MAG: peptide deformylase [Candidatus Vogelbacteria bacterium]|nr:peptide deformylase [Candidatus Vogelbacteria bacterium]
MPSVKEIVQEGDPVLRQTAKEVPIAQISRVEIQSVLQDMRLSLNAARDGVGLAAPQIGIPLRIFIVSSKILAAETADSPPLRDTQDIVFVNPKITRLSKKTIELEEGCLSTRNRFGKIIRSERATVTAYDENGKRFTRSAGGLLAEIFQHEIDHLNGVLFIDKARDIHVIVPEESHEQ